MNSIFKVTDFTRLYFARLISTIGDRFFVIAFSWWIINSGFENANSLLGIVMAATAVGSFGLAPFVGVLADKYSKKKCMIISLLGGAIAVLGVILAFPVLQKAPLIFALFAVFLYALDPLFDSAMQGSLNYILPPKLLTNGVSLVSGITSFSQALGALCAGVAITLIGIKGAFIFDLFTYLISAILVYTVVTKIPLNQNEERNTENQDTDKSNSYFYNLKEGFRYVYSEKPIFWLLIFFAFVNLWVSPIVIALPIIAKDVFNGTALLMSWFEVSLAIGIILISSILGYVKLKFDRYKSSFFAILICGISQLCLAIFNDVYITFIALILFGVGVGLVNVSMMTIFQTYVPTYLQGRFFSIVNTVAGAVIPLSYGLVGFLSDVYGIMPLMQICGTVLLFSSVGVLFAPRIKAEYII